MSTASTIRRNAANLAVSVGNNLATKGWRKGCAQDADFNGGNQYPLPVDMAIGRESRSPRSWLVVTTAMTVIAKERGCPTLVAYNDRCKDKRQIIRDLGRAAKQIRNGDYNWMIHLLKTDTQVAVIEAMLFDNPIAFLDRLSYYQVQQERDLTNLTSRIEVLA